MIATANIHHVRSASFDTQAIDPHTHALHLSIETNCDRDRATLTMFVECTPFARLQAAADAFNAILRAETAPVGEFG